MKLIILYGPPAVGKMTVGFELSRMTSMKLLHNHMTIDLVLNFFDWKDPKFKLADEFRYRILEEFVSSDEEGIIVTYAWALDLESDNEFIKNCCKIFEEFGAPVFFVELEADLEIRKVRNESAFRLEQKPSKRNIEKSRKRMMSNVDNHVFNSSDGSVTKPNFIKINNANILPKEVARRIVEHFDFITI